MTAFVASSVWFACVFAKDRHNKQAKAILGSKEAFVTTDAVRRSKVAAEPVLPPDYDAAWEIGVSFPDQRFSILTEPASR